MTTVPQIYDINIDEFRDVTQTDVDTMMSRLSKQAKARQIAQAPAPVAAPAAAPVLATVAPASNEEALRVVMPTGHAGR